jgi:AcrR family transcriptional regulator
MRSPRRDKERTRERILEAAMDVFSDKGYAATLIDDIARESDTSKGAFYFHFPSKKAIFEALLKSLVDRLTRDAQDAIAAQAGAVAKIEAALRAVLGLFARHEKATRLLFVEAVGLGRAFEQPVRDAHRALADVIATYLQQAVDDGSIPPIPVSLTAYAWLGAIHEVVFMNLSQPDSEPLEVLVAPLCNLLVGTLGARPPGQS